MEDDAREVSLTVMVEVDDGQFTAFDVYFKLDEYRSAVFAADISADEAISPGSSSPSHGWVGWQGSDVAAAWQWPEVGEQGVVEWRGRSPFSDGAEDAIEDLEGLARLAAALILMHYDGDREFNYLPAPVA